MPPVVFSGSLQPKKKFELQDIAAALKISDQGTKDEIQSRIKKHLDNHQSTLEDNPRFAGLYGRRRRSAQPQSTSRFAMSEEEQDTKPISTRSKDVKRGAALDSIEESTPASDLNDGLVVYAKKATSSPEKASPAKSIASPKGEVAATPSSMKPPPPSLEKDTVSRTPGPPRVPAIVHQMRQTDVLQNGAELFVALRIFLSNSRNIWSLTAVVELLYVLSSIIPWRATYLPLTPQEKAYMLPVFYPPMSAFQTSAFWLVMLHWSIPTLIVPAIVGNLISFTPGANALPSEPSSATGVVPFDPLTASIVRLAAQIAYPYSSIDAQAGVHGLDVLGFRWRVLNASIGLAFAFAEAIAGAPQAFAKTFLREQRQLKTNLLTEGEVSSSDSRSRKAITGDETLVDDT
ncbi:hypothetical protein AX17_006171 [Amanita inopinata Kibby_2008]|nr:hypothetical protein AX17_006171 [Amanita inopinata Kibby_2008]